MELLVLGGLALAGRMLSSRSIHERAAYKPFDDTLPNESQLVKERWDKAKTPQETGVFANKYITDNLPNIRSRSHAPNENYDDVKNTKLELFTGVGSGEIDGSWLKPRKREQVNFMKKEDNMVMVTSSGSGGNPFAVIDRDRFVPSMYRQNESSVPEQLRDRNAIKEDPLLRAMPIVPNHTKFGEHIMPPIPGMASIPAAAGSHLSAWTRVNDDKKGAVQAEGFNGFATNMHMQPAELLIDNSSHSRLSHPEYFGPGGAPYPLAQGGREAQSTRTDDRSLANSWTGPVMNLPAPETVQQTAATRDHRDQLSAFPRIISRNMPAKNGNFTDSKQTRETDRESQGNFMLNESKVSIVQAGIEDRSYITERTRTAAETQLNANSGMNAFAYSVPTSRMEDTMRPKTNAEASIPVLGVQTATTMDPRLDACFEVSADSRETGHTGIATGGTVPMSRSALMSVDDKILTTSNLQPEKGLGDYRDQGTLVESNKKNYVEESIPLQDHYGSYVVTPIHVGETTKDPRKVCPENPHPPPMHLV